MKRSEVLVKIKKNRGEGGGGVRRERKIEELIFL